jgi:hypothetical protein
MRIVFFVILTISLGFCREWEIKRNPFVVSKNYMDKTGKHYLMPKDTYAFLDISIKGIFYKNGLKTALLDLDDKGFIYIQENEVVDVDTADIKSRLKAIKIEPTYMLISINGGEAIRHEIK